MLAEVHLDDGPSVQIRGKPAQGTRHEVMFGLIKGTDQRVAVKVERTSGALEREYVALQQLQSENGPAPRLVAAGPALLDGERLLCVVTEWRAGKTPTTNEGWQRMGRAFARLTGSVSRTSVLPVLDHAKFGREHAQRVSELGDRIAPFIADIPDWELLVSALVPEPSPMVLTHGDPGPGNFLDDGHFGTLVDWEDAHIAPRGLDLSRLIFIALLGAGPSGFHATEHGLRARSVADGYLGALEEVWCPSMPEMRWWTTVAGIQFIHRRWRLGGQPAPWEDAAAVLRTALTDPLDWNAHDAVSCRQDGRLSQNR